MRSPISQLCVTFLAVAVVVCSSATVFGQIDLGDIEKAFKKVKKVKEAKETGKSSKAAKKQGDKSPAGGQPAGGTIVFSKSAIDIDKPANLTTSFKAGDHIYAAMYLKDSFKKLCKGSISTKATKAMCEVKVFVDGSYKDSYNVTVKDKLFKGNTLLMELAPDPAKMTSYSDANIAYKKRYDKPTGPYMMAGLLSGLEGGSHKIKIELYRYGQFAVGEFEISGDGYAKYEQLQKDIMAVCTRGVTMPQPKKVDKALEAEMTKVLKASGNAAWAGEILRVVIIDRDWFIERHKISGAILFRYIRAAVAVKAKDGKCWLYDLVTFKQQYIGDKFAEMKFDGAGNRKEIPPANVK